ncbi:hypothetical protein P8452_23010 [Trifolium repens]|nr:hypothetical protein P8452_23010 [Trifolium repens]
MCQPNDENSDFKLLQINSFHTPFTATQITTLQVIFGMSDSDSETMIPPTTTKRIKFSESENEDRLISAANLQVLSLVPNLLEMKLHSLVVWHPSFIDCTVINVDVSYLNDVGRAGFGVLFRTGDGLMVDGYSGFLYYWNVRLVHTLTEGNQNADVLARLGSSDIAKLHLRHFPPLDLDAVRTESGQGVAN